MTWHVPLSASPKPLNVLESEDETSLDQLSVLQNGDFFYSISLAISSCQCSVKIFRSFLSVPLIVD